MHAWEARPGSGERGPDGRQAGEFTLDEALVDSFRFNLSRQIVGEVRGKEIWAMIKAMESGTGSISTTHAADAEAADPQARHLRDGGRPARHPRLAVQASPPPSTSSSTSTSTPHPTARRAPGSGTAGSPRSSPSPPARRETGYATSTSSAPPPASGPPPRTSCPTPTAP